MAEPNMIYKIAALEMLDKAGEPLSNMQITPTISMSSRC